MMHVGENKWPDDAFRLDHSVTYVSGLLSPMSSLAPRAKPSAPSRMATRFELAPHSCGEQATTLAVLAAAALTVGDFRRPTPVSSWIDRSPFPVEATRRTSVRPCFVSVFSTWRGTPSFTDLNSAANDRTDFPIHF
jgi:hypothetical protein